MIIPARPRSPEKLADKPTAALDDVEAGAPVELELELELLVPEGVGSTEPEPDRVWTVSPVALVQDTEEEIVALLLRVRSAH